MIESEELEFDGLDYEEDRCMGYDCTIKEDYIMRMTVKYDKGAPVKGKDVKLHSREVKWGEEGSGTREYKFGLGKKDTLSEAWELFEESVVNQSMCGKPHPGKLVEIDVGRVHYDHGKWVCYTRERRFTGDNQEGRKSQIKSYDELNTLDEALETLSGKL